MEHMEEVKIGDTQLELPQSLCEDSSILKEFFSKEIWDQIPENIRQHAMVRM